ncbi:MAG: TIGR00282 family metallophosphoesterase [Candidatus Komeilibacteria bacterium]|nr:TIGR00282 family metallophosphoesterase [Candidatus Komeilibacteria bacterium]
MIKIIFIADIIGKIGRRAVQKYLPQLKAEYRPDLVMANAENVAHGIGFTRSTLAEMQAAGVDFFTSGNHAWEKAGSNEILNQADPMVIRPANYPAKGKNKKAGLGFKKITTGQIDLIVVNLMGRVFIEEKVSCPFKALAKIIVKYPNSPIIVDFHAEATSEKNALAKYFDGQVSAVIGTHTHVATADEKILPGGTACITDAGMVGYYDSVIGADKNQIFNLFLKTGQSSKKHDLPDSGEVSFDAVYLEIDEKTKQAKKIKRINKLLTV